MVQQNTQHHYKTGIDFSLSPNTKIPLYKKILNRKKTRA